MMRFYHNNLARLLLVATLIGLATPLSASAHQLGHDNGVSVILHVNPDDEPVAGKETQLVLYYGATNGPTLFNTTKCTCTVTVAKEGKQLVEAPIILAPGVTTEATAEVKFPVIGAYDVTVAGRAMDGSFPTFRVPFVVRVDTASTAGFSGTARTEQVGIAVVVGLIVLGLLVWGWIRRNNLKRKAATL